MSTYTPIASQTLSSAAASVTFSGIPQTYTDLVVVLSVRGTTASNDIDVQGQFNSDTGSNYSWTRIYGTGSTAGSQRGTSQTVLRIGNMAGSGYTAYSPMILNIQNYSNTTTYKTMLGRPNNPDRIVDAYVNLWRSTSAVTSFVITPSSGNFDSGSTFNLYGIDASLSAQAKATGGTTIIRDSSYWYHVFTGSGTFTPTQAITADVLVVAGGGGAGDGQSGGGGAGGLLAHTSQSISIINIQNYANTTTNKTVLARGGAAESYVRADVGLWRST